ncbi:YolD-like family protein [Bacillus sp. FJAT-29814]|nr:YolD-like family protein [Bacillus sp. FJAT-29814]MCM3767000.1 YolD-like family protein [Neobacillus niacini]
MYLKKLTENNPITIDYYSNGSVKTIKGRVKGLSINEQLLSIINEKQESFTIRLSGIRRIH